MKIKDQVCTAEQAVKLSELGVTGPATFYHVHQGAGWQICPDGYFLPDPDGGEMWAAFTAAELGAMLAHGTGMCTYHHGKWKAEYQHANVRPEEKNKGNGTTHYLVHQAAEAEARAAFLIYSIENGFLKAEEVNQRISI